MLLQSLDFMEDKIELRRLNQVISTPDQSEESNKLPRREKSTRIKRQAENKRLQNSHTGMSPKVNVQCVCVLFQFIYAEHDKLNKITINIEAATRLFACARGFKNIRYRIITVQT